MAKDLQSHDGNTKTIHWIFVKKNNSLGYGFKSV